MYPFLTISLSSVANRRRGTARSDEWLLFVAGMINHPGGKQICSDAEKMKMKMKRRELWKG